MQEPGPGPGGPWLTLTTGQESDATLRPYILGSCGGYVPERPLPKMAVETAANKKKPLNPPNSMIGQFTAVLGTAFMG